ncbi:MAG: peptidoglycan-binding protein [Chitinophagales bacterium]|nr:peptidoglycan-binding protein [Chitinophagales bacterium]
MRSIKNLILLFVCFAFTANAQIYIDPEENSGTSGDEIKELNDEPDAPAAPSAPVVTPTPTPTPAATPVATPAPSKPKAAVSKPAPSKPAVSKPVPTEAPATKSYSSNESAPEENSKMSATMPSSEELPSWAKPGKCYARCMIPDQYEFKEERVIDRPATVRTQVVPATYETVYDTMATRSPSYRTEKVPAQYETISEEIMVAPASTKWIKGKGNQNCLSANPEDCQVMCLVEVPATYKTVSRKVMKSPAYDQEITIPGEFKFVARKELKDPERMIEIEVPATYKSVMKKVLVKKGGLQEWKEVLCSNKLTTEKIIEIQTALKSRGYDPGPLDDVLGPITRAALVKYQRDKNLPVGNLNMETLKSLGVE